MSRSRHISCELSESFLNSLLLSYEYFYGVQKISLCMAAGFKNESILSIPFKSIHYYMPNGSCVDIAKMYGFCGGGGGTMTDRSMFSGFLFMCMYMMHNLRVTNISFRKF